MTTKIKILAATALIALSACNNNDNDNVAPVSHFPADGVIHIVTDPTLLQTRTGTPKNNVTDYEYTFDLSIKPKGGIIDSAYIYDDITMLKVGKTWNASRDNGMSTFNMLWQDQTTPLEVTAVSMPGLGIPLGPDSTFKFNISADQEKYWYFCSLVFFKGCVNPTLLTDVEDAADNISEYALKDGCVRIPFRRVMSKLNITLTLGTNLNTTPGTAENPVTNLKVLGTNRSFILMFKNGSVTANKSWSVIDSVVPKHNNAAYIPGVGTSTNAVAKYECILVPQTIAADNFFVEFLIDGKVYGWHSTVPVTLESGKEHFLSINLSNEVLAPQKTSALRRGYGGTKSEPAYIALDGTFNSQSSQW